MGFIFCLNLFSVNCSADLLSEKTSEAFLRQSGLDKQIEELTNKYIPKQLQLKIGNVSLIVNIFLQKKIEYKVTFP